MATKPRDLDSEFPIHVCGRTNDRQGFPIPLNIVWELVCEQLYLTRLMYGLKFHAFLLMPNHFHLIARDPELQLSNAMKYFMKQSSIQINLRAGKINHMWGNRFKSSVIRNPRYYLHAYKYLYRNPVKANLCETVVDWPYSTLPGLLGLTTCFLPIEDDEVLFNDVDEGLQWLQTDFKQDQYDALKAGFRRKAFELRRHPTTGRENDLNLDESVPPGLAHYKKLPVTF